MGRVGTIEELQNLAVFLMSDGCDWLTGQTISMDGGQAIATGGNFYDLRAWSDEDWRQAREAIKAQDAKDRDGPRLTLLGSCGRRTRTYVAGAVVVLAALKSIG